MTLTSFQYLVKQLIEEQTGETDIGSFEGSEDVEFVNTYEEQGILSSNKGLVVRLDSGDEFQLTMVQSKYGNFK